MISFAQARSMLFVLSLVPGCAPSEEVAGSSTDVMADSPQPVEYVGGTIGGVPGVVAPPPPAVEYVGGVLGGVPGMIAAPAPAAPDPCAAAFGTGFHISNEGVHVAVKSVEVLSFADGTARAVARGELSASCRDGDEVILLVAPF